LGSRVLNNLRSIDLDYRMECILDMCEERLRKDYPDLPVGRNEDSGYGDFGQQRYLQVGSAPGFWIAYEDGRCSLMFGNNRDDHDPNEFQSKLQNMLEKEIGAGLWEEYEGHPGGTIMVEERLRRADEKEILGVMMDAFRTFVRLRGESDGNVVTEASI
jgi:hypothetical protein